VSTRSIDQPLDHIQKSVAQSVRFTDGMSEDEFEHDERTQPARYSLEVRLRLGTRPDDV
jgi:uncharacterized protein with HEPN domain